MSDERFTWDDDELKAILADEDDARTQDEWLAAHGRRSPSPRRIVARAFLEDALRPRLPSGKRGC
jgi:hypothetical protein